MNPFALKLFNRTATPYVETNAIKEKISHKAAAIAQRMFKAAMPSRLGGAWQLLPQPTNWVIRSSLRALRARSREQWENNPYVKRFADLIASNVVGHKGILAHPNVKQADGTMDDRVNKLIHDAYTDWGQGRHCDVGKSLSFPDLQRLAVKTLAIDGEIFIRMYRDRSFKYGFAMQIIDPEFIDLLFEKKLPNGNYILQGIEYNKFNAPVAYHIYQPAPGDSYATYAPAGAGQYIRVPAEEMLHVFVPFRVDQRRGVPMTSNALNPLKMLDGYMEAAVVAARVGASTMGFFHSVGGEQETIADDKNPDGSLAFDAEPGTFRQLPNGVDVTAWKPDYPSTAFQPFVKTVLRQVASGLGISYTSLSNDIESVNYSSIRQDALQDRELYRVITDTLINRLIQPAYENWIQTQLMIGTLKLPRKTLMLDEVERYSPVRFAPRVFHSIDPIKDAQSRALEVINGLRSRSDVIRHEFGQEPDDVWAEIAQENKKMAALGLSFDPNKQNIVEQIKEDL
ncbi:MAG: phage portal protein [Gammaproteobacteria bacterium]